jgi:hypothetical protein
MFVYPLCYSLNPLSAYLQISSLPLTYSILYPFPYSYYIIISLLLPVHYRSLYYLSLFSLLYLPYSLPLPFPLLYCVQSFPFHPSPFGKERRGIREGKKGMGSRREWGPLYSSLFSPPFPPALLQGSRREWGPL